MKNNILQFFPLILIFTLAIACVNNDNDEIIPTINYTVTFDTDGGTPAVASQTVKSGEKAQKPDAEPSKVGFAFENWVNTADNTEYDFTSAVTTDLSIEANYVKAYTITFDTDGGTPAVASQTVKSGEKAQKPDAEPSKVGFAFENWVNTADNTEYNFTSAVTTDLNIRATYTEVGTFTVSFETNGGGAIKVDPQIIESGGKVQEPSPLDNGCLDFVDWYLDETFANEAFDFNNESITKDVTLYAKWEDNSSVDDKNGSFTGVGGHTVSGNVSASTSRNSLCISDSNIQSGPKLEVWISKTETPDINDSSNYRGLGELKSLKDDHRYFLPGDIDLTEFKYVNIWCEEFSVSFGVAQIK